MHIQGTYKTVRSRRHIYDSQKQEVLEQEVYIRQSEGTYKICIRQSEGTCKPEISKGEKAAGGGGRARQGARGSVPFGFRLQMGSGFGYWYKFNDPTFEIRTFLASSASRSKRS